MAIVRHVKLSSQLQVPSVLELLSQKRELQHFLSNLYVGVVPKLHHRQRIGREAFDEFDRDVQAELVGEKLENEAGLETTSFLGWGSVHLGFNTESPKLQDVRVRRAMAHAVDKGLIVDEFFQGLAEPAVSPVPPTVRFATFPEEPYPYNPDEARRLLQKAGAEGLSLRLDIYQSPDLEAVAQVVQAMLAEVGVTLDIRTQEYAAYVEATQADDAELYATSWGTVTLDADYTLYAFFHSSEIPQNNLSRYRVPEVDASLDAGRETPDDALRERVYAEVQEQVLEDVPLVTLYYPYSTYAKRAELTGETLAFSWINLDLRDAVLSE